MERWRVVGEGRAKGASEVIFIRPNGILGDICTIAILRAFSVGNILCDFSSFLISLALQEGVWPHRLFERLRSASTWRGAGDNASQ